MNRMLFLAAVYLALGRPVAIGVHAQTANSRPQTASPSFELVDGDRVVLLGSGFIEAAQEFGYIELALTTRWPDGRMIFRNLGWSGDTVFGEARARFTSPPTPYERLLADVTTPDPTVIFIGYGSNPPFEEGDAIGRFEEGLGRLLSDLGDRTDARIVLLSPPPLEADASPAPAEFIQQTNDALRDVSAAIAGIARERDLVFVDVFHGLMEAEREAGANLTYDGIQLNAAGHVELARVIEDGLGLGRSGASVLQDGSATAAGGEKARTLERLRRLIIQKNRLYFQQYRPPNETYLVGFRSYEQGQNAGELERLTPLIMDLDVQIDALKRQLASRGTETDGS